MTRTPTRPRAHLTPDLDNRLRHLAVDQRRSVGDLLGDAVLLLLRWHSVAEGLPAPTLPRPASATAGRGVPDGKPQVLFEVAALDPQESHVLAPAVAQAASARSAPPTHIEEVHLDENDDDDEEVEELIEHPDRRLAAAGFRVPRGMGIPRPLTTEDAGLTAIPNATSPVERHAVNPNEKAVVDLGDSRIPIGHSAPAPLTPTGDADDVEQDPLLAEAGIRVRRGTGTK
jgi:hypothetical protein